MAAAIGATGDFLERAQELVRKKVDVIAVDAAHGHSQRVMDAVKALKHALPDLRGSGGERGVVRRRARFGKASVPMESRWALGLARFAQHAW